MVLDGKRILLFSVAFFNYEKDIYNKLIEQGAIVDLYNERSIKSAINRALLKVVPRLFDAHTYNYYKNITEKENMKDYDFIFFFGIDMITKREIMLLREKYPNAKIGIYMSDSWLGNEVKEKLFDKVDLAFTYDRRDFNYYKEKYPNFRFRPLFYGDNYKKWSIPDSYKYDLAFIGTVHSDRYYIINKVRKTANTEGLRTFFYCYLQSHFIYLYYKLTNKYFRQSKPSDFSFDKMAGSEVASVFNETLAVLDMQHPKNTGLTMRTIETLGMQRKLITTNSDIENYDFYDPVNILIIDRKGTGINMEFFNIPYKVVPSEIREKYSLDYWLESIFNELSQLI